MVRGVGHKPTLYCLFVPICGCLLASIQLAYAVLHYTPPSWVSFRTSFHQQDNQTEGASLFKAAFRYLFDCFPQPLRSFGLSGFILLYPFFSFPKRVFFACLLAMPCRFPVDTTFTLLYSSKPSIRCKHYGLQ